MTFRSGDRARIKIWSGWVRCMVEKTQNHDGVPLVFVRFRTREGLDYAEWRFADELRFPHGGDGDIA